MRLRGTTPEYIFADHLGSPIAATGATATVSWRERYAPYGEKLTDPPENRDEPGFTSHVQDHATGLTYMQARFYDPMLGRFLSIDPIGHEDQLNLYAYVGNDPLNLKDPTGEFGVFGAISSVALGMIIRGATGGDVFDAGAIATDAALGSLGAGIVNKATQLNRLRQTGLPAVQRLGATNRLSSAPNQGVYVLREGGETYVGQSGNLTVRSGQSAAERGLQNAPGVRIGVEGGGKASREVAEQRVLNSTGGRDGPGVLNAVNPIGSARSGLMQNPNLGNVTGVYAQGVSEVGQAAIGLAAGAANNCLGQSDNSC